MVQTLHRAGFVGWSVGLPRLRKVSTTRGEVIYQMRVLGEKEQVCLEPKETLEIRICLSGKLRFPLLVGFHPSWLGSTGREELEMSP